MGWPWDSGEAAKSAESSGGGKTDWLGLSKLGETIMGAAQEATQRPDRPDVLSQLGEIAFGRASSKDDKPDLLQQTLSPFGRPDKETPPTAAAQLQQDGQAVMGFARSAAQDVRSGGRSRSAGRSSSGGGDSKHSHSSSARRASSAPQPQPRRERPTERIASYIERRRETKAHNKAVWEQRNAPPQQRRQSPPAGGGFQEQRDRPGLIVGPLARAAEEAAKKYR